MSDAEGCLLVKSCVGGREKIFPHSHVGGTKGVYYYNLKPQNSGYNLAKFLGRRPNGIFTAVRLIAI